MQKILVIDDADVNRAILKEIFKEQYEVIEAADGEEGIAQIDTYFEDISLIFLDLIMPKKDGLEVLSHMRHRNLIDMIPVIMITGEATVESDVRAYEYGAADIIYKPFAPQVVMRRAENLIELYRKKEETDELLSKRTEELRAAQQELTDTNEILLDALGSVAEFRSLESSQHIKRVKQFTTILLQYVMSFYPQYDLTPEKIEIMASASALHDVGKIAISDAILNAPRRLTETEFFEMKKHTVYGCDIIDKFMLKQNDFYKYSYEICRWHHEKVDGKGYPDRLVGDEIPIYCQAVSLADCFEALVSKRTYKGPIATVEAYNMIKRGECGAFSDVIMDCFDMAKLEMFCSVDQTGE